MIRLVLPNAKYKRTYIEACKEFQEENNPSASNYLELNINELENNFEGYVVSLLNQRRGIDLPSGYVPATEYWIIDDNDVYLGRVHIRHCLTEHLSKVGGHIGYNIRGSQRGKGYASLAFEIGLRRAKALGIDKVLITCDDDNVASIKIIEKHGGVLENKVEDDGHKVRRYWIDTGRLEAEVDIFGQFRFLLLSEDLAIKYADEINASLDQIPEVEPHTTDQLMRQIKGERKLHGKWRHSIIALAGSVYAGVAIGYERDKEPNDQFPNNSIYLSSIAVSGKFQRQGLGKKLVEVWLEHNQVVGFLSVDGELEFSLQTNSADWNKHVQNLYEGFGFKVRATKQYNNRLDNIYSFKPIK